MADDVSRNCTWADPTNLKAKYFNPEGDVAGRVPQLLLVLAAVYAFLGGIGALLLRNPTKAELRDLYGSSTGTSSAASSSPSKEAEPLISTVSTINNDGQSLLEGNYANRTATARADVTTFEVIQSSQGWLLWGLFIMTASGGVFVIGSYKTYAEGLAWGKDDKYLALVGSLISISNCIGQWNITHLNFCSLPPFARVPSRGVAGVQPTVVSSFSTAAG